MPGFDTPYSADFHDDDIRAMSVRDDVRVVMSHRHGDHVAGLNHLLKVEKRQKFIGRKRISSSVPN
jgi:metal-dependent hydrolase (beta-lactamase superfamily II)